MSNTSSHIKFLSKVKWTACRSTRQSNRTVQQTGMHIQDLINKLFNALFISRCKATCLIKKVFLYTLYLAIIWVFFTQILKQALGEIWALEGALGYSWFFDKKNKKLFQVTGMIPNGDVFTYNWFLASLIKNDRALRKCYWFSCRYKSVRDISVHWKPRFYKIFPDFPLKSAK